MTPPVDTAKLRELVNAALPGLPWKTHRINECGESAIRERGGFLPIGTVVGGNNDLAELIVALVNSAPALLDELDASRAVVEAARRPATFAGGAAENLAKVITAYDRARGGQ